MPVVFSNDAPDCHFISFFIQKGCCEREAGKKTPSSPSFAEANGIYVSSRPLTLELKDKELTRNLDSEREKERGKRDDRGQGR